MSTVVLDPRTFYNGKRPAKLFFGSSAVSRVYLKKVFAWGTRTYTTTTTNTQGSNSQSTSGPTVTTNPKTFTNGSYTVFGAPGTKATITITNKSMSQRTAHMRMDSNFPFTSNPSMTVARNASKSATVTRNSVAAGARGAWGITCNDTMGSAKSTWTIKVAFASQTYTTTETVTETI